MKVIKFSACDKIEYAMLSTVPIGVVRIDNGLSLELSALKIVQNTGF